MQSSIAKADVLIEALPYIQSFRHKVVVIKFGGSIMDDKARLERALHDIVFMEVVGMKPIIIHGGGKNISRKLEAKGKEAQFVNGLRVTDKQTLEVVEDVLMNEINPYLVETINRFAGKAFGLSGRYHNCIKAVKYHQPGSSMDLGFVGEVSSIDVDPIFELCEGNIVPVIAPLGVGVDGNIYNINADLVAAAVAVYVRAEKLVCLTDAPGLLKDKKNVNSLIQTINQKDIQDMIDSGMINEGMIPKVEACLLAVKEGVHKTHIIDGRIDHSLLLEIFTDKGIGTQIVP